MNDEITEYRDDKGEGITISNRIAWPICKTCMYEPQCLDRIRYTKMARKKILFDVMPRGCTDYKPRGNVHFRSAEDRRKKGILDNDTSIS